MRKFHRGDWELLKLRLSKKRVYLRRILSHLRLLEKEVWPRKKDWNLNPEEDTPPLSLKLQLGSTITKEEMRSNLPETVCGKDWILVTPGAQETLVTPPIPLSGELGTL